ncbi:MAG TPA: DinB family protein [Rudaea sp.]|jgi:uncharacterized damage-inducible protein DinB|nr:DinB family protein [Rudaea sp.]
MADLGKLVRYKAWANERIYTDVAKLPEAALTQPDPIIFGNLLRTLHHTYAMDHVWRSHLLGESHGLTSRNPDYCPTFPEVRDAQRAMDRWFIEYADGLTPDTRNESVSFTFIGGKPSTMSREDIVLHVVNHGTYHRGHVAGMMHKHGVMAPTTDYPVFLKSAAI